VEHETQASTGESWLKNRSKRRKRATRINLHYPASTLGSRKERMGQRVHATYGMLFESYMLNTGDFPEDDKGDGQ